MHKRCSIAIFPFLMAAVSALLCGAAGQCSEMVITDCPTSVTTDADGSFCFEVTVKNVGRYPGAVRIVAKGSAGVSGLDVEPEVVQLAPGEDWTFKVCGKLTGQSGTVTLYLIYTSDNERVNPDWKRVTRRVAIVHR